MTAGTEPGLPTLLVVWHSRTGASEAMAQAVAQGAGRHALLCRADTVGPSEFLSSSGFVFICPENLGSMSGLMKEMFDRCYYPLLGRIEGRPYASIIAAGSDGEGAQRQVERIVTGWRLKRVAEHKIVNFAAQTPEAILAPKIVPSDVRQECQNLGYALSEGMSQGIF